MELVLDMIDMIFTTLDRTDLKLLHDLKINSNGMNFHSMKEKVIYRKQIGR